ncbi:MAG TPA: 1-deoxy-D-xylulose-5-phosphate synthase [Bacilli bacterium]
MLERISRPDDLKKLPIRDLETLAYEIRQFLIARLSATGGHLAPNLGVVELTIALHYLYNSPQDKIIFDVGHQGYIHKILTGRKDEFATLRQYKGLSGFLKRRESEHDVWEAGHSSTSLSAALGMAIARDAKGENHKVIAVIGDGALTGGMALEALNHIGHEKRNLLVVLNDNEMSIAPNVGALHNYLSRIRADKTYRKAKEEIEYLLKKIPHIGGKLAKTAEKLKDSLKYLVVTGVLFEELGFTYFGPVDGHHLEQLIETFRQADNVGGPVLVHVVTVKGKGFIHAENDAHKWHGVGAYKIESGDFPKKTSPPTYTEVFGETLLELARRDERIMAITPAMPGGSGLIPFAETFPERMIDVGIAEQHAATLSGALALAGMKPVFAVYSTFAQRAYDQIVHDICRQNLPVVLAIDRAGLVGPDGETHQGVFDIPFLRHIPNMTIMMPKDENELRHMLYTAVSFAAGPVAVRYPRAAGLGVKPDQQLKKILIGKWEMLIRPDGAKTGAAILAVGPHMVQLALAAADRLNRDGMIVAVVNARFIKPLDEEMLLHFAEQGANLLTLEESSLSGGFGGAVMEFYAQKGIYGMRIKPMGIPDRFVEHGSIQDQLREAGLTLQRVLAEMRALMPRQSGPSMNGS